ncbi:MAG: YtjB family periplasmic protein [Pseudomonadota bacterium]
MNPNTKTRAWLRFIAKRLLRLATAAALLLIIYNVWNIASLQSQQQLTDHTRQLTSLALDQVEFHAIEALQAQNIDRLQRSADRLSEQQTVLSVVFRNPLGEPVVSTGSLNSVIDWPTKAELEPWIMTRELNDSGSVIGYVQVIFNREQLLATSDSAHDGLMQQGRVLLLLAMLAGVFLMLGFNRIRDRFWNQQKAKG